MLNITTGIITNIMVSPFLTLQGQLIVFLCGSFVFFGTRSIYNRVSGTYDARHNKMTEDEFRGYIQRSAEQHARDI